MRKSQRVKAEVEKVWGEWNYAGISQFLLWTSNFFVELAIVLHRAWSFFSEREKNKVFLTIWFFPIFQVWCISLTCKQITFPIDNILPIILRQCLGIREAKSNYLKFCTRSKKRIQFLSTLSTNITCKDALLQESFPLPTKSAIVCFYHNKIAQKSNANLMRSS